MTYNPQTGSKAFYDELELLDGRMLKTDINVIAFDKQGGMWAGTERRGLLYSRPFNVPFRSYGWDNPRSRELYDVMDRYRTSESTFEGRYVNCAFRDSRGWTWVGTNQGLQLFRKEFSCIVLKDNNVDLVASYNTYDQVPPESFANNGAACTPDGMVVMQMLDHMLMFYPRQMKTIGGNMHFEIFPQEIDVNYDQNSLTLMFSALNYFRPQHTYYRVRVSGLDDQWHIYSSFEPNALVDKSGRLRLQLMALAPGTYDIEIQASMNPNEWTTTPYKWTINVNEPWWRSSGVYWLLGLVLLILVAINAYFYLRNDRMFARRAAQERPLLKNIRHFAERCTMRGSELLEPSIDEIHGRYDRNQMSELTPEFIEMMIKLMPYVMSKPESSLTMRDLGRESGMEISEFYKLITANIYKNPRPMALSLLLDKGIEMMRTTNKDIEEIASELGFVSPNYFVAAFYQRMHKTPEEYRQRHKVKSVVKDYKKKKQKP